MTQCCVDVSKCIVILCNATLFFIAAATGAVSIFVYSGVIANFITKPSLLVYILVASGFVVLMSLIGCRVANSPPRRKCSRFVYLFLLLVVILAEFSAAALFSNLGNSLEVAKDHHFDIESGLDSAAIEALTYLHDQIVDLYESGNCTGGEANGDKFPIDFSKVHCGEFGVNEAFSVICKASKIINTNDFERFSNCSAHFTAPSVPPSGATQIFCSSEAHIVALAQKWTKYLTWCPAVLTVLTLLLFVATIVLISQSRLQQRRRQLAAGQHSQRVTLVNVPR